MVTRVSPRPSDRRLRRALIGALALVVIIAGALVVVLRGAPRTPPLFTTSAVVSDLTTFTCLTSTHCLGVGINDVEASSDAGATWVPGPSSVSDLGGGNLENIQCVDGRCYAVGGGAPVAAVLTSADEHHWLRRDVPQAKSSSGYVWSIWCQSASECLVGGGEGQNNDPGTLYRTVDAGVTWQRIVLPRGAAMVWSISCPSSRNCVALTGLVPPQVPMGAGTDGYELLSSSDAGRHWSLRWRSTSFTPGVVSCAASHCVAVVRPNLDQPAIGTGPVMISDDAGVTWRPSSSSSRRPNVVSCPSRSLCVGLNVTATNERYVGLSRDGGVTWRWQTLELPAAAGLTYLANNPQLQCVSASRCAVLLTSPHSAGEFFVTLSVK